MAKQKKQTESKDVDDIRSLLGARPIVTVKEFISTGSTLLDYAIANRKNGGIPVGRITEISGDEQSGKTLMACHVMANTQRKDGIAVLVDIERSADETFMRRLGVDPDHNFIYPKPPKSIEGVFEYIENVVKVVRNKYPNKEKLVTIVWDSVAATTAKEQIEVDYGDGRIGPEARAMSQCFKKAIDTIDLGYISLVCLNQLRTKIGVMFGDPLVTPHGKSLPFYSSCRLRLKALGKIVEGDRKLGRVIGRNTSAEVIKNRMGPPWRKVEFPVYFDFGIDDHVSFIDYLKDVGVISQAGAWSTLNVGEGHKFQGTAKFKELMSNTEIRDKIFDIIDENMIIKLDEKPKEVIIEDSSDD